MGRQGVWHVAWGGLVMSTNSRVGWIETHVLPKDVWRHVWKEEEDSRSEKWRLHDLSLSLRALTAQDLWYTQGGGLVLSS